MIPGMKLCDIVSILAWRGKIGKRDIPKNSEEDVD